MKKLAILIFLILLLSVSAWSASYERYLDVDCGVSGGDGSTSTCSGGTAPWDDTADFNDFIEATFGAGDSLTLYIKKGTSISSMERLGNDGDHLTWPATGDITITTYGAGADPVFDVSTMGFFEGYSTGVNFTITGNIKLLNRSSSYIKPTYFNTVSGDITIEYLTHDGGSGTCPQSSMNLTNITGAVIIRNNTIYDIGPAVIPTVGTDCPGIAIIDVDGGGDATPSSLAIYDNTIYNINSDPLIITNLEFTGVGASEANIYGNNLYNFGENAIDLKGVYYFNIYENTLASTAFDGGGSSGKGSHIVTHVGGGSPNNCKNVYIYNNFLDENSDTSGVHYPAVALSGQNTGGVHFYNNLIKNSTYIYMPGGLILVWNNIWRATEALNPHDSKYRIFYVDPNVAAGSIIAHNSVKDFATDGTIQHGLYVDDSDVVIKNNLIWLEETGSVYALYDVNSKSPTADNNKYWNPNDIDRVYYNGTAYQHGVNFAAGDSGGTDYAEIAGHTNEESAEPDFNDPDNGDFSLTASDAGENLGASYDLGWDQTTELPPTTITTVSRDAEEHSRGVYVYQSPPVNPPTGNAIQGIGSGDDKISTDSGTITGQ